ncbi:hypothetical protein FACS1894152_6570 [Bacilli bacterium]|nr:hypothetical protein FACS1894152_6570 [Bacilli bacterium]
MTNERTGSGTELVVDRGVSFEAVCRTYSGSSMLSYGEVGGEGANRYETNMASKLTPRSTTNSVPLPVLSFVIGILLF